MTRLLLVALAAAVPAATASGQTPTVRATASKTEVTVGEPFVVELKTEGPAGTTWTFPAEAGSEQVELIAAAADPQAGAPPPGTQRYQAAVFTLGEAVVPPVSVQYRLPDGTTGTATSEPIALSIVSLLPRDAQEQTLTDIRPPLPLGVGRAFWLALALALVTLAALAVWLRARRRKRSAPAEAPALPLSPDAEALAALDRLQASGVLARGEYRPFYIALAEVAKRYLERRLSAPVLEMTSSEAVAFLREHAHGQALAPVVRELASAADQVKFARGEGRAEEAVRHLSAVRQLVAALEARLSPPPAAQAGASDSAKVA